MSETDISKLLSRIATLEARAEATARAPAAPQTNGIDPAEFLRAYAADPIGTLQAIGASPQILDYSAKSHVVYAMEAAGQTPPHQLKALVSMGPQISATNALASEVQSLRQRIELQDTEKTKAVRSQAYKALISDKSKYPSLAKAMSADPTLFDGDLDGFGGTAEEFAVAQEARLAKLAPALGAPAASAANAEATKTTESKQVEPALASGMNTAPPLPEKSVGVFTADDHASLRDEIVRKHSA